MDGVEPVTLESTTLEVPGSALEGVTLIVLEGVASAILVNGILSTGCIIVGGETAELNAAVLKDVSGTVSPSVVVAGCESAEFVEVEDICCNRFLLDVMFAHSRVCTNEKHIMVNTY